MKLPFNLNETRIKSLASTEIFQRGRSYERQGNVLNLTLRGNQLQAEVAGSHYEPYLVQITFDQQGIAATSCTCPYDWGNVCKHVVAVLLASLDHPDEIEERPALESLLQNLSKEQLRAVLLGLAAQQPEIVDAIDQQILALQSQSAVTKAVGTSEKGIPASGSRQTPLDAELFRRQARAAIRATSSRGRYIDDFYEDTSVVDRLMKIAEQARPLLAAGDGRNAMAILEGVTDASLDDMTFWERFETAGSDFFDELGSLWTEAILTADLTPQERKDWARRFTKWQQPLSDYSLDEFFDAAKGAAIQGWDDPALLRALSGEISDLGAWPGEAPDYADALAIARLTVLERQGRFEEYLHLAEAESQTDLYLAMLVRLGRIQQATEYGTTYLTSATEVLQLAKTLHDYGAINEALQVAHHGLAEATGDKATLARWLRDQATIAGQHAQALDAALLAQRTSPSLADYQAVETLSGKHWPTLRGELLDGLRQRRSSYPEPQIAIFLHEGLLDDAIAALEAAPHATSLIERVVDAALDTRPDWVVTVTRRLAEEIMDGGLSQQYRDAISWLEKTRAALMNSGRLAEWQGYLESLIVKHKRKYSLLPMLQALRSR